MVRLSLSRWWQSLPLPWQKWRIVGHVSAGDEVPRLISRRGVILVGPPHRPTWAAFDCPCGSGHRLMLNLDPVRHPTWQILSLHPLSLLPSIDFVTTYRRCHFVLRNGRIAWVHDRPKGTT